jgi:DNA recombination-dependent growth factor C
MGLLSTSASVVRMHAQPPARIDRAAVADSVTRRAFREPEDDVAPAISFGWVGLHDPLATELSPADLFFQRWFVVGFRYDRRAVPAKLSWLERRRAEERRKQQDGVARLGKTIRQEIKQEVENRLLDRALPGPRLFDCAWNLETGQLYFTGKLRAAQDAFTALFRETFTVAPMPMIPYLAIEHLGLSSGLVDLVRAAEPVSLVPDAAPVMPADVPRLPIGLRLPS